MRGNFIGKASLNKRDSKFPCYAKGDTKNGGSYNRFYIALTDNKNNRVMTELFGVKQDVIKVVDKGNTINIKWEDRKDKDMLATIPYYKKIKFKFLDEEVEFLSAYDAVEYLNDHSDLIVGKTLNVYCNIDKNIYNGKISDRFTIQRIESAEDSQPQMMVTMGFFFDKDVLDKSEWKKNKRLYFNGYVQSYIPEKKATMYVPQMLVLDASKVDMGNKEHYGRFKLIVNSLGCETDEDGNDVSCNLKGNAIYKTEMKCRYINSAQEVPFDESMLTPMQRDAIASGVKKLSDFADKKVYGERVTEYRTSEPTLVGDYANGYVNTEMTRDEFDENAYIVGEAESEDILDKAMNKPVEEVF